MLVSLLSSPSPPPRCPPSPPPRCPPPRPRLLTEAMLCSLEAMANGDAFGETLINEAYEIVHDNVKEGGEEEEEKGHGGSDTASSMISKYILRKRRRRRAFIEQLGISERQIPTSYKKERWIWTDDTAMALGIVEMLLRYGSLICADLNNYYSHHHHYFVLAEEGVVQQEGSAAKSGMQRTTTTTATNVGSSDAPFPRFSSSGCCCCQPTTSPVVALANTTKNTVNIRDTRCDTGGGSVPCSTILPFLLARAFARNVAALGQRGYTYAMLNALCRLGRCVVPSLPSFSSYSAAADAALVSKKGDSDPLLEEENVSPLQVGRTSPDLYAAVAEADANAMQRQEDAIRKKRFELTKMIEELEEAVDDAEQKRLVLPPTSSSTTTTQHSSSSSSSSAERLCKDDDDKTQKLLLLHLESELENARESLIAFESALEDYRRYETRENERRYGVDSTKVATTAGDLYACCDDTDSPKSSSSSSIGKEDEEEDVTEAEFFHNFEVIIGNTQKTNKLETSPQTETCGNEGTCHKTTSGVPFFNEKPNGGHDNDDLFVPPPALPWQSISIGMFGGKGSLGNGAAMRVAPLGAFFGNLLLSAQGTKRLCGGARERDPHPHDNAKDSSVSTIEVGSRLASTAASCCAFAPAGAVERIVREAVASAIVTHWHTEAILGAVAIALASAFVSALTLRIDCGAHNFTTSTTNSPTEEAEAEATVEGADGSQLLLLSFDHPFFSEDDGVGGGAENEDEDSHHIDTINIDNRCNKKGLGYALLSFVWDALKEHRSLCIAPRPVLLNGTSCDAYDSDEMMININSGHRMLTAIEALVKPSRYRLNHVCESPADPSEEHFFDSPIVPINPSGAAVVAASEVENRNSEKKAKDAESSVRCPLYTSTSYSDSSLPPHLLVAERFGAGERATALDTVPLTLWLIAASLEGATSYEPLKTEEVSSCPKRSPFCAHRVLLHDEMLWMCAEACGPDGDTDTIMAMVAGALGPLHIFLEKRERTPKEDLIVSGETSKEISSNGSCKGGGSLRKGSLVSDWMVYREPLIVSHWRQALPPQIPKIRTSSPLHPPLSSAATVLSHRQTALSQVDINAMPWPYGPPQEGKGLHPLLGR